MSTTDHDPASGAGYPRQHPEKQHPAIGHVLQFFTYDHLPPHLRKVSLDFALLAKVVAARAPGSVETAVALRKLLEAKDAAVRAVLIGADASEVE